MGVRLAYLNEREQKWQEIQNKLFAQIKDGYTKNQELYKKNQELSKFIDIFKGHAERREADIVLAKGLLKNELKMRLEAERELQKIQKSKN